MQVCDKQDTYWEKVKTTEWGRYITSIEKQAILFAQNLAPKQETETAIELGCDGGIWAELLTSLGWQMVCTDICEQSLNICQKRLPKAKCILVNQNDTGVASHIELEQFCSLI